MDMKAQDLFPYLENMNVCVGPVTEDMLPADANADNTVCIGVCCKKLADAKGFRWVVGAAPRATPTSSRASSATARSMAFAIAKLLLTLILFTYSILPL